MTARRHVRHKQRNDVWDLFAAIVGQARYEWQSPTQADYYEVCWGEEMMGYEPCMFRQECYPPQVDAALAGRRSQRFRECIRRRTLLKLELIRFFNSPWFDFILGDIDPDYVRRKLGVPTL